MIAQGIIRKISIGDLKTGITYVVGQKMMDGRLTIVEIKLDVDGAEEIGSAKYDILVNKDNAEHSRIWKTIIGMPTAIEYDIEEEKDA